MRQVFGDEGNRVSSLVFLRLYFCFSENLAFIKIFIQNFYSPCNLYIYIYIFLKSILEPLKNYEIQDGGFTK